MIDVIDLIDRALAGELGPAWQRDFEELVKDDKLGRKELAILETLSFQEAVRFDAKMVRWGGSNAIVVPAGYPFKAGDKVRVLITSKKDEHQTT